MDPRLTAVLGGLCISLASMFIHFSNTPAPTSAFWRCLIAFPVLLALYARERRTERRAGAGTGPKPTLVPLLAGAALGVDFVLWAEGIRMVGAGISTVLLSVQVVIVPTAAYLLHGERTSRRFVATVPVLLLGVVLAGGLAGTPVTGADPLGGALASLGAGTAYAFYLLLVRRGGGGVRALLLATVSAGAVAVAFGVPTGQLDLTPGWASLGWLAALALIGQIVGWLLISAALPRMPSSTGAALMLVQPVGSVVLGIALMGERPNAVQLVGCAAVLLAVYAGTRAPRATGELDRPERAADDPAAEPVQTGPEPATPANLGART
ncbi:Permease of the drug/metabolite transporter (DMT) superfamily [Actinosynnema pretiosum]|nr:Permease of the drug/metabolite transporter (DMT) superfamily [Actinosynnema pretiosum]